MMAGANDRIRVGLIGAGGRGRLLTAEFKEIGVDMAAVCDVYQPNLQAGLKAASAGAKSFDNYKRMLEDQSLQAVIVATPDHWHAQMVIDAVEAGKDVYVEKPLAHKVEEGFAILDAVKRTKRIVQVGTQRRSYDLFLEAKRVKDTSDIGDVRLVNGWWYNHQASVSKGRIDGPLDWKQWLGPAPQRPVDAARFRNWYYYYDYSGGLMIGQAAHIVDSIVWLMGSTYPSAVTCAGGRANLEGVEIPETTTMLLEYPENYLAVFTVGYKAMRYSAHLDQLVQYNGSKARYDVGRESYALYREDPKATELKPAVEKHATGTFSQATRQHIRNFLDCIRTRAVPNAPAEVGQYTNVALCMALEALRSGKRVRWNNAARRMET